jgi:hypothetical protein
MKKLLFATLLIFGTISLYSQSTTATLKSPGRLFATKDDLTSVIMIIPADSVVSVLDSDSTYLHVQFEDNEGYIFNKHVIINKGQVRSVQTSQYQASAPDTKPAEEQMDSRYTYLENKYGTSMANRLISGKIWKGINSEMVKDSWGIAEKVNRVINNNTVKEEWIYKSTWLYFENNTLVEWGPVKK